MVANSDRLNGIAESNTILTTNGTVNGQGGIRLNLPHHYLAAAAAPPEPDYDIYADLPKPTKNSVSCISETHNTIF